MQADILAGCLVFSKRLKRDMALFRNFGRIHFDILA